MRRIARRLERDLGHIADHAPVSSPTWEDLRRRIAAEPERSEEEIIMFTPADTSPTRRRWILPVIVGATTVGVAAVIGVVAFLDRDDEPESITNSPAVIDDTTADDESAPAPTEPPEASTVATSPGTVPATTAATSLPDGEVAALEGFSFATDDLCEWVSEADVAEWVAAEFDWEGSATEVDPTDVGVSCEWRLESSGGEDAVVTVRDAALWRGFDGDVYDFEARMAEAGITEYPPPQGFVDIGAWVVGHPAVSEGVVVHNGGFGQFAFGMPSGPWLQLSINWLDEGTGSDDGVTPEEFEASFFAVADRFLQELGWVPTPSSATTESDATTPTGPRDVEVVAATTSWNPVLDGIIASPAPPAAACDARSAAVDGEQELPEFMQTGLDSTVFGGPWTRWFAAFDPTTHSVTVLGQGYDSSGRSGRLVAGSLDVCTDTWSPISTTLQHPDTGEAAEPTALAYDVDSDAMVAYTTQGVFVHDTELDEWQHHPVPRTDSGLVDHLILSAAYHPASGKIIVAAGDQLVAHDVDTDDWDPITSLPISSGSVDFLGVNVDTGRFVIGVAGTGRDDETTRLADPVSGEAMVVETPEHSHVDLVWPNEAFGPADGTVFVTHRATGELCGFDAETLAWDRCVTSSTDEPGPGAASAIVGDPVNDRLIAISTTNVETWPLPPS